MILAAIMLIMMVTFLSHRLRLAAAPPRYRRGLGGRQRPLTRRAKHARAHVADVNRAVVCIPIPLPRKVLQTSCCTHLLFKHDLQTGLGMGIRARAHTLQTWTMIDVLLQTLTPTRQAKRSQKPQEEQRQNKSTNKQSQSHRKSNNNNNSMTKPN